MKCRKCNIELMERNWEKSLQKIKMYLCHDCHIKNVRKNRLKVRKEVLSFYSKGTMKCNRCGFSDERVLSIDHIFGHGGHQKQSNNITSGDGFYRWLIKNNFPEGFQVLCMNCQWIKRRENKEERTNIYRFNTSIDKIKGEIK